VNRDVGVKGPSAAGVSSLRDLTGAPITAERLRAWSADDAERESFLAGTCWGQIAWDKALGRPLEPSLAGGFAVEHSQWVPKFVAGGDIWVDQSHWAPLDDVAIWDLPAEGAHLRVGFMFWRTAFKDRVTVEFAGDRRWEATGILLGPRAIEPPRYEFEAHGIGFAEFHVVEPVRSASKTRP
jgi:hypothetical protein